MLSAAALTESVGHAAILVAFYAAGVAIPFLATALALNRMTAALAVVKRPRRPHHQAQRRHPRRDGVLIWTGELFQLNAEAEQLIDNLGLNFFDSV